MIIVKHIEMRKLFILFLISGLILSSCTSPETINTTNPLLSEFTTEFQVPPFDEIKPEHYMPAFEKAMAEQKSEIEAIITNEEAPDFTNTIVALDASGRLLREVSSVFYSISSANTNDALDSIKTLISPLLSSHGDDISLNADLFARVKAVYEQKDKLNLNAVDAKLLEETYKDFTRGGANLNDEDQAKLREINKQLSLLSVQFNQNLSGDANDFKLIIENEADLAGLPEGVVIGAAETAKELGMEGKWVFTTQKPSMLPFLTYAENRDLREKIYKAYTNLANNDNQRNNQEVISKIAKLRVQRANVMGYDSHADFILEYRMAQKPEKVYELLYKLWTPALARAKSEVADMQKIIDREGGNFKLAAWDWWYYAEKVRNEKYNLEDTELRPYFSLKNVRQGALDVASKLYGLSFVELENMPKPHPDAVVYQVKEADGSHKGILYMDFHPRASKRSGAWCGVYRKQHYRNGENVSPVVTMVMNFSKPTGDKPALLSFDETSTLFHEFGHALHQLLSNTPYYSMSGTSVPRDFVELPSQIMENWATHPEVMKEYAKHYETGEVIPDELIEKLTKSGHFNQGFATIEYLAASILDMDYHTLTETNDVNVEEFENKSMNRIGLISEIAPRYRSTYFRHIFASGYSAGYYSYIWAGVLDADAFEAFKETSLYDKETATAFRTNILEKGGTGDAMEMYKAFRGSEPKIEPLLQRRGLN